LLGDPIEAKALGRVLSQGRAPEESCIVGSVKTNIGHLEAAAGIAGLIKVALSLKHGEIPRSLHFETPNPHIPFEELRLLVQHTAGPWPDGGRPRIAGVSSFGFGGTNAHVVLEGAGGMEGISVPLAKEDSREAAGGRAGHQLTDLVLPLSAHTPEA